MIVKNGMKDEEQRDESLVKCCDCSRVWQDVNVDELKRWFKVEEEVRKRKANPVCCQDNIRNCIKVRLNYAEEALILS